MMNTILSFFASITPDTLAGVGLGLLAVLLAAIVVVLRRRAARQRAEGEAMLADADPANDDEARQLIDRADGVEDIAEALSAVEERARSRR